MRNKLIAGFLALHGVAHFMGVLVSWELREMDNIPYDTTLLNGAVDVGDFGMRFMGLLWIFGVLGFFAVAYDMWQEKDGWKKWLLPVNRKVS